MFEYYVITCMKMPEVEKFILLTIAQASPNDALMSTVN